MLLNAIPVRITAYWDVTPCSLTDIYQRPESTFIEQESTITSSAYTLSVINKVCV
jgi:hypothetical protein